MRIDAVWLDLTRSRGIGTYGCLGGLRGTLKRNQTNTNESKWTSNETK